VKVVFLEGETTFILTRHRPTMDKFSNTEHYKICLIIQALTKKNQYILLRVVSVSDLETGFGLDDWTYCTYPFNL
jgi:hypothetical protein